MNGKADIHTILEVEFLWHISEVYQDAVFLQVFDNAILLEYNLLVNPPGMPVGVPLVNTLDIEEEKEARDFGNEICICSCCIRDVWGRELVVRDRDRAMSTS